jgi:hypothetical protein
MSTSPNVHKFYTGSYYSPYYNPYYEHTPLNPYGQYNYNPLNPYGPYNYDPLNPYGQYNHDPLNPYGQYNHDPLNPYGQYTNPLTPYGQYNYYRNEPIHQPYATMVNPQLQPSICECVTSDRPFTLRHSIKGGVKVGNRCTPGDDRCWCFDTCDPRKNKGRGFNCGNESVGGDIPEDSVCNILKRSHSYGL